ncbi:MAG: hypothetical protein ABSC01_04745 [Verrucomicrobiota bacterium]
MNTSKAPFILTANGERIQLKYAQIQRAMKPRDIFKDIFGLAVRLLGLVFLYLGLSAVPLLLDFGAIETAGKSDLLNTILPIIFNLAVAWWLIGGGLLIRRAYPEASRISPHSHAQEEGMAPVTKPIQSQGMTDMNATDKKLASLVGKPKDGHAA